MIVDAVVEGYHEYVEHRKDRNEKMIISSAFAWTKGNFIESKIAEECIHHGFHYKKSKAGMTWDYLQFIDGNKQSIFLIKNAAYFNEDSFSQAKLPTTGNRKGSKRTYLHELSKINSKIDFPISTQLSLDIFNEQTEQLTFYIPELLIKDDLQQLQSTYSEFHILTYSLDEAYQVSEIKHYLPNPNDNIAYLIEDLSEFISGAELTDEEREVIAPVLDDELIDASEFDLGILTDDEVQNE